MEIIRAIVLGVVQGLTEFLPVSSSGHLVLGQHLFGLKEPELLFDVLVHAGTLVAVFLVFYQDIWTLILEFLQSPRHLRSRGAMADAWRDRPYFRLMLLIIIGSIPTGLMGFLLKDLFESLFASPLAVGVALLITGTILFMTRNAGRESRELKRFRPLDALIVGVAQGFAITPGISRSGITICTGQFLGLERELAARFSFLLSIPAILGALVLQIKDADVGSFSVFELGIGFGAALFSGLFALIFLLKIVRKGRLHFFSVYCWLVGLAAIIISLTCAGG